MKFTSLFPLMTQTLCLQFGSLVASHPSGQGGKQPDLPRSSQAKPINYRNGQISIHNEPSDRCSRDGTVAACASIFCYDKEPKCAEGAVRFQDPPILSFYNFDIFTHTDVLSGRNISKKKIVGHVVGVKKMKMKMTHL